MSQKEALMGRMDVSVACNKGVEYCELLESRYAKIKWINEVKALLSAEVGPTSFGLAEKLEEAPNDITIPDSMWVKVCSIAHDEVLNPNNAMYLADPELKIEVKSQR